MFKIHHYGIPTILLNLFRKNNVVHSHNTRSSNSYHISSSTSSNFMSYCIQIWNAVYNKIHINVSYPCFKKFSRVFLLNCDINTNRLLFITCRYYLYECVCVDMCVQICIYLYVFNLYANCIVYIVQYCIVYIVQYCIVYILLLCVSCVYCV